MKLIVDPSLAVASLFFGMSIVAGWCPLKILLSTQACSTYAYLKKFLRNLKKHLGRGRIQPRRFARKIKKFSTTI